MPGMPGGAQDAADIVERNAVTGKPVAIVGQNQWRTYPNAEMAGSCYICGWPRGFADVGKGEQMMCAAGHVFTPQRPDPTGDAGQGATTSPEATAAPAAGEQVITLPPGHADRPEPDAAQIEADAQRYPGGDGEPVDLLALVNLKLTTIMVSLGLPTDPDQMLGLIMAAAEQQQDQMDLLSDQLAQGMIVDGSTVRMNEPGSQASGQPVPPFSHVFPPDMAALYQLADPEPDGQ